MKKKVNNTYQRRKAAHICVNCEAPLDEHYPCVRCYACREEQAKESAMRHAYNRRHGLCPSCGKPLPKDSRYKSCDECRERTKLSQQRHRAMAGAVV